MKSKPPGTHKLMQMSPVLFSQFLFLQDCHEGIDMYRSFCMKLINFTIAHAILMIVKLLASFLFTACIPIVYGTYGGEEKYLWS